MQKLISVNITKVPGGSQARYFDDIHQINWYKELNKTFISSDVVYKKVQVLVQWTIIMYPVKNQANQIILDPVAHGQRCSSEKQRLLTEV